MSASTQGPSGRKRSRIVGSSRRRNLLFVFAPLAVSFVYASSERGSSYRSIHSLRAGDDDLNAGESRFWPSQSLHRINEDVMAGARSFDTQIPKQNEEEKVEEKKRGRQGNRKQQRVDKAPKGRGGAVTTRKDPELEKPPTPPRTGLFRWLTPSGPDDEAVDTIEDDPQKQENDSDVTESKNEADLAKLWMVNLWTQQLPERLESPAKDVDTALPRESKKTSNKSPPGKVQGKQNNQQESSSKKDQERNEPALKKQKKKDITTKDSVAGAKNATALNATATESEEMKGTPSPSYVSSGAWAAIDGLTSLGLSRIHPAFRISRLLRPVRKLTARMTGLHGTLSGKPRITEPPTSTLIEEAPLGEEDLAKVRRRIAAIDKAREGVEKVAKSDELEKAKKRRWWGGRSEPVDIPEVKQIATVAAELTIPSVRKSPEELQEEKRRKERVKEIDRLMSEAQVRLSELACEKDELQRRPNPLWNYTTKKVSRRKDNQTTITTRQFSFPRDDLVDEYLDFLFSSGRLVKLNHTDLWQNDGLEDDDDELIGDDLITDDKRNRNNGNGGNWILRQSLGKGSTLGEKIGEAAEQAAYKAIGKSVMAALARSISAFHGVNIMTHTDIRLSMEATPDLPPIGKHGIIPGGRKANYARDALQGAMRRGARKNREKKYRYDLSEDEFVQRDAVVETLLSQCLISAPLLQLFPQAWQRAMLSNIITLVTAVVADFCEGIQFEILGHRLSFSFQPITESDMITHIAMAGPNLNRQSLRSEQFEAAVQATANDLSENLKFLDRWHERALGSGMLRSQIANLIARLVLTLAGEVLSGAQMDLWAAQAGGPRMVAGLEFRTTPTYMEDQSKL